MKVALVNLKGGSGKTTSSVFLAAALAERGRTLLIDADPQGSALSWSETAGIDEFPCQVVSLAVKDLHKRLPGLSEGYDHVVIDTPPGDIPIVRSALLAADVAVVTLAPNLIEIDRMQPTLTLMADIEALNPEITVSLLFTRVRRNTNSYRAAREFLAELGLPILDTEIPLRERFSTAFGLAPSKPEEYESVLKELLGEEVQVPVSEPADVLEQAAENGEETEAEPEQLETPGETPGAEPAAEESALSDEEKLELAKQLIAEDEAEFGPIPEEILAEVREKWPAEDAAGGYSNEYGPSEDELFADRAAEDAEPAPVGIEPQSDSCCESEHDWQIDRLKAHWEVDPPEFLHRCTRCGFEVYARNTVEAERKAKEGDA